MSVTPLRQSERQNVAGRHDGAAASVSRKMPAPPPPPMVHGAARQGALYSTLARRAGLPFADAILRSDGALPDLRLMDALGVEFCLREGVLPIRHAGGAVLVAVTRAETLTRHAMRLQDAFGHILPALITPQCLDDTIGRARGAQLARRAETSVAPGESCRNWGQTARVPRAVLLVAVILIAAMIAPQVVLGAMFVWAVIWLVLSMLLRVAAAAAALRPTPPQPEPPTIARLPTVSIIVALYRESGIASRLVRRLGRLEWPRENLDLILAVEADDHATRIALDQADLPGWMRVVIVPPGHPRTKPRALNYALSFCRGSIIGVYDAEDAPEPDQIEKVVARFHARGPHVACLQGRLDYYNPATNWLSRCFTIEYAAWFRLILPGIARLGIPVPLGGTTLFFRRAALEELGGWDAHNVTEDADLGIRLWRRGYRTELIDTTTGEEANCRVIPWIKQRSRWIKGYMMTWLTHMRDPVRLWRDLGPVGFAGFQILFLGSLSQALFAPVLWSFWLLVFGYAHPLATALPVGALTLLTGLFAMSETVGIAIGILALRRTRHRLSWLWVPTLHLYHPLAAFAAWKAAWEMAVRPFWWDKTAHGLHDAAANGGQVNASKQRGGV